MGGRNHLVLTSPPRDSEASSSLKSTGLSLTVSDLSVTHTRAKTKRPKVLENAEGGCDVRLNSSVQRGPLTSCPGQ